MKKNALLFIFSITILFGACKDSDDSDSTFTGEYELATDVLAGEGGFTFYSLRTGEVVQDSNSTAWDIGLKNAGFEIFIITNGGVSGPGNGGAILLDMDIDEVVEVPSDDQFATDTEESYAINPAPGGWWIYTGTEITPNHAVLPKDPHTILVRTADGGYAKLEVVSYYQGNPDTSSPDFANFQTRPASGYFTFNYEVIAD